MSNKKVIQFPTNRMRNNKRDEDNKVEPIWESVNSCPSKDEKDLIVCNKLTALVNAIESLMEKTTDDELMVEMVYSIGIVNLKTRELLGTHSQVHVCSTANKNDLCQRVMEIQLPDEYQPPENEIRRDTYKLSYWLNDEEHEPHWIDDEYGTYRTMVFTKKKSSK